MPQRKQKRKAQAKEENAAAAGAICENVEAKTEENERLCKETWRATVWWQRMKIMDGIVEVPFSPFETKMKAHRVQQRPCRTWHERRHKKKWEFSRCGKWRTSWSRHSGWEADNEETAEEAGGRHRARPVVRTVNEENDFSKFHKECREQYGWRHGKKSNTIKKKWKLIHRNRVRCCRGDCQDARWRTSRTKHSESGNRSFPRRWSSRSVPTLDHWGRFYRVTCQQQHERS